MSSSPRCRGTGPEIPDIIPNAKKKGNHWVAPCPFQGGEDRMQIYDDHTWCRACGAYKRTRVIPGRQIKRKGVYVIPDKPPVGQSLAAEYHDNLRPGDYDYFAGRGISRIWADLGMLGWKKKWERYSIPCFYQGQLWALQYRASKYGQTPRYLSESGSFSDLLYGYDFYVKIKPQAVVIVEGPLDALALWSHGYPAVSRFCGNNTGVPWHVEFSHLLSCSNEKVIVADNDEPEKGLTFAKLKAGFMPGSRVVVPQRAKDVGEMLQQGRAKELPQLLGLFPNKLIQNGFKEKNA